MASPSLADFRDPAKFVTLDRIRHRHNETDEQRERRLSAVKLKKRHCLLAVIEVYAYVGHVRLGVRDRDGAWLELKFPRDVVEDDPGRFVVGHTIAVMNPDWYPLARKVFPYPLGAILRANAGVVAYTPPSGAPRACHACGSDENVSMECVPCRFVAYCDKSCQRVAWRQRGHMMACQVLRNPDIRRLMELDYDSERSFRFDTPMSDDA
ncbi:hypothetical protein LZ30DRAFT_776823 [Colletotrichum cereale]|nr:hypothetical protein LZ30DRAFT_776823 [Colletotrichum cereale]